MKKVIAGLLAVSMLIIPMQSVFAEENNKSDSIISTEQTESIKTEFEQMFGFNDSRKVSLKDVINKMFVEFDSQEDALYKIKNKCYSLLDKIKEQYNLDDLSEVNWQDYYDGLYSIIDDAGDGLGISETDYEYRFLRVFFDIYENRFKNDKVDEISSLDLSARIIDNGEEKIASEVIANNLPYQSNFSKEYFEEFNMYEDDISDSKEKNEEKNNLELRSSFDIGSAVSYASAYATSPNTPDYYYFSHGDCTNFVSQILEAGGISQEVYDSEYFDWWHKFVQTSAWSGIDSYSRSWTMTEEAMDAMAIK